jgi:hypothetical protein
VTVWDDVRQALLDFQGTGALTTYPDPRGTEDRPTPIQITLAPWATHAAEDLHRRFGDNVALVVGVLPYPTTKLPETASRASPAIEPASPADFGFELEGKAQVRSGERTRIGLRVHNHTPEDIIVRTNGSLTASVLDPARGDRIGGYSGFQAMPLIRFTVPAVGSAVIPFLIGTTSFRPELGYAVPPGQWAVSADLKLEDGRVLRTPAMAITVTG